MLPLWIQYGKMFPRLKFLAQNFTNSAIVVYEQVRLSDPYGLQMVKNLHDRGCPLLGISPTPRDLALRLHMAGWSVSGALDMLQVWSNPHLISDKDKVNANAIECLDEFEEWNLIQSHYTLALASTQSLASLFSMLGIPTCTSTPL